ncbi:MAG: hypothetical protein LBD73_00595 [Deferribacteraceae bacterium]|jgi:hypothetical protein|nr:hypothetical protein [Deferribacteraceae bacterium]
MKISRLLIIISTVAAVLGVISRWSNTFAGRFGFGGDYFLKTALHNSYAYLIILFIPPLIFAATGRLTRQNAKITAVCGAIATLLPIYFLIAKNDDALGTLILIAAGIGLFAGGFLRLFGKAK